MFEPQRVRCSVFGWYSAVLGGGCYCGGAVFGTQPQIAVVIRSPQFAVCGSQSAIRNPQSAIRNPLPATLPYRFRNVAKISFRHLREYGVGKISFAEVADNRYNELALVFGACGDL